MTSLQARTDFQYSPHDSIRQMQRTVNQTTNQRPIWSHGTQTYSRESFR